MKRSLFSSAYYNSLSLRNFRGFKSLKEMPLAPLTFLVGPNSCGKSSLFNAFLFLTHNNMFPILDRDPTFIPSWQGSLVDLGSFNDTVFNHNDRLNIHIGVGISINPKGDMPNDIRSGDLMQYDFDIKTKGNNTFGYISKMNITDIRSNEQAYLRREPPAFNTT